MSSTSQLEAATPELTAVPITPRRARIDGPHPVVAEPPLVVDDSPADGPLLVVEQPAPELIAAIVGQSPEIRQEQLELQAAQLGDHLRQRLREVDRREAHLNARAAQLEADQRASRIWLREREHEFQEREAALRRQIEDLQAARPAEGSDSVGSEATSEQLAERQHAIGLRENELRERRFEFDRQAAALRHAQQLWQQEREREEAELARERGRLSAEVQRQSAERDERLAAAEEMVFEAAQQLEREQAEFTAERRAWDQRRAEQARELAQRTAAEQARLDDLRQRLDARTEWIDREKAGLEELRAEVLALHRQALETRLVAEQLWTQINGRLTPTEITQSTAQLRLKLAEHYRLEEQSLKQRKDELLALGERLGSQHRELSQLQGGLKDWLASRQAEIEAQAASLVQRELTLDQQQQALADERQTWQSERRALERQIAELTRSRVAAA
jgi:hypothetical protein